MSGNLARAVDKLHREGILDDRRAAFLYRVATRGLVSVRLEIRLLLYAGVLLTVSGIGFLVKERFQDIGPVAISLGITLATVLCFVYVFLKSPSFARGETPSPTLAFDYVLLLGVLLFGADLGYLESQFTVLGPAWPWHLLIVSLVGLGAAYRFDSRTVLTLALTTFAAWRGVSVSLNPDNFFRILGHTGSIRINEILAGLLFLGGAVFSRLTECKPHFEEVYGNIGLLLLFAGLWSGLVTEDNPMWPLLLFAAAGSVIWLAWRLRRPYYFAQGVLAAYFGLLRYLFEADLGAIGFLVVAVMSLGVIFFLVRTHRHMREGA
jgi:hypothetical protein